MFPDGAQLSGVETPAPPEEGDAPSGLLFLFATRTVIGLQANAPDDARVNRLAGAQDVLLGCIDM